MTAPTLAILAGSPPAPPKLASVRWIHQQSRIQSCRSTSKPLARLSVLTHAWPQTDRGNRSSPTSARQPPWPNPHSARGTAAAHLPRFRALALFGRRPPERVEAFVIPASENLHRIGRVAHSRRSSRLYQTREPGRTPSSCSRNETTPDVAPSASSIK